MHDAERLLETTMPFVEDLLKQYGEFFPVASAIKINGDVAQVGTYNGDDHPLSSTVITELKDAFRAKQADYTTIAIFYDVRVTHPSTISKTDAIAVFIESRDEETAYTIFYPYILTDNKQIVFAEAWKELSAKEIFGFEHL